ncbi:MAG: hypothetical protein ACR2KS_04615 [Candidatus Eremiobacter antarcticus]
MAGQEALIRMRIHKAMKRGDTATQKRLYDKIMQLRARYGAL